MLEAVNGARKPLVLVVDDEQSICNSLCSVLEDEAFLTLSANDGAEALEKVKEHHPDLVFLDIWMPGWDGVETLEKIKQIEPATEVIMISGHATIANALEATRRGAFDFIEKPLDIDNVLLSANRALEKIQYGSLTASGKHIVTGAQPALISHPGVCSVGLRGENIGQRTIARSTILYGQCLHSGQKSGLVLEPLPPNSGIHFAKIGETQTIPAFIDSVDSTAFATTVNSGRVSVSTIEHLMSALHAYRITNLLVKCNDEVPIFDGSALEICKVLDDISIEEQKGEWYDIAVDRELTINGTNREGKPTGETITLEPSELPGLSIVYELNYPAPVGRQVFSFYLDGPESYKNQVASARTFGFMRDIEKLQKAGLAAGGRLNNFILIGDDGVVNTQLRFPEELARHKVLDAIGDLYLIGRPIRGKVVAKMTGHSDNAKLIRELRKLAVQ